MKKTLITALSIVLLISCGKNKEQSVQEVLDSNNLEQLRAKKDQLDEQQQSLAADLKLLNQKISELDTNKKVPLITVINAKENSFNHFLELQGSVQTKKNVLVYPEVAGQLVSIYVREGQQVNKGQALAKIDDAGMGNQLAQLEANAELAKTTYERQKRLWDQKIGSEIQYLQAKTNYEAQMNAVTNLRKNIAKFTIRAPFAGIIDDVIKEQGTVVAPGAGAEVFRIVNLGDMYIETDVPENYITSVTKGKDVQVEFPILGKTVNSKIRQAGNFINPANRTFKVEIGVSNKDRSIKPNLTAKLKINDYTNPSAILIPQSIISENAGGEQYVYVVENIKDSVGKAKQVVIETGKTQGDIIEVVKGITNGDTIVNEGARSVKNGQEVKILTVANTK
ncbi:efflux RND transporter periplasmic adaptor subunit [Tenacibaculum sp. IB213877]|uniref:efflux RND transporter periplasmic adaptor subunit n=1 Tax=Tenacibaculum sp. IB213877 TaxID=3097351 RepID=UPI002A5A8C04|nr:efflux RND transporter periplasmic adaptor subunit [Tenacibaculum sp. IB213877]MDY0780956.1 efflux RND transporter periplasmic adaptor subunit [Tenacibaculum sp. IB213877]